MSEQGRAAVSASEAAVQEAKEGGELNTAAIESELDSMRATKQEASDVRRSTEGNETQQTAAMGAIAPLNRARGETLNEIAEIFAAAFDEALRNGNLEFAERLFSAYQKYHQGSLAFLYDQKDDAKLDFSARTGALEQARAAQAEAEAEAEAAKEVVDAVPEAEGDIAVPPAPEAVEEAAPAPEAVEEAASAAEAVEEAPEAKAEADEAEAVAETTTTEEVVIESPYIAQADAVNKVLAPYLSENKDTIGRVEVRFRKQRQLARAVRVSRYKVVLCLREDALTPAHKEATEALIDSGLNGAFAEAEPAALAASAALDATEMSMDDVLRAAEEAQTLDDVIETEKAPGREDELKRLRELKGRMQAELGLRKIDADSVELLIAKSDFGTAAIT